MSRINYSEPNYYEDTGCEFHSKCKTCPYPLVSNDCLLDWTVKERQAYFKDPKNVLDIKFGADIGKKPFNMKFGLTPCPNCGKKRWLPYPYQLGCMCSGCAAKHRRKRKVLQEVI